MHIVVITGSPHKQGTSFLLAQKFIRGATEAGHTVFRFDAAFEKVHPCIGCDACAANLMRPAIYGSYHHISVMGKENAPCDHKYDVTGGLCENNDKFAVDRMLPEINIGDLLFIHDAGAHGFSMGYNYNGKLRSAELLLQEDGSVKMIRRAETPADYFATFDFGEYGPKLAEEAKIKM